jgi:hypothetical protein
MIERNNRCQENNWSWWVPGEDCRCGILVHDGALEIRLLLTATRTISKMGIWDSCHNGGQWYLTGLGGYWWPTKGMFEGWAPYNNKCNEGKKTEKQVWVRIVVCLECWHRPVTPHPGGIVPRSKVIGEEKRHVVLWTQCWFSGWQNVFDPVSFPNFFDNWLYCELHRWGQ